MRRRCNSKSNSNEIGKPITKSKKYGNTKYEKEYWLNHRLSFFLNCEKIPKSPTASKRKKKFVLHTCDNKWCINPKHLYLGTQAQNINDMFARNEVIIKNKSISAKGNQWRLRICHSKKTKRKMSKSQLKRWKKQPITENERKNRSLAQFERYHRKRELRA